MTTDGTHVVRNKCYESLVAVQHLLEFPKAEIQRTEGGTQKSEAFVVRKLPSYRNLKRVDVWEKGFGQDVLALRGVQSEASVVQSFLEAGEESPCGFVETADGPVVEV